ncbi:hypothetical protein C8R42DRAFT_661113 [Lentinula raphanica]|nr:hypothetical protein C8R42DRAFT_661113 [Lentinula raphanica]
MTRSAASRVLAFLFIAAAVSSGVLAAPTGPPPESSNPTPPVNAGPGQGSLSTGGGLTPPLGSTAATNAMPEHPAAANPNGNQAGTSKSPLSVNGPVHQHSKIDQANVNRPSQKQDPIWAKLNNMLPAARAEIAAHPEWNEEQKRQVLADARSQLRTEMNKLRDVSWISGNTK